MSDLEMVEIPPGSYRRSDGARIALTRPFALQRTPVTVVQYTSFLRATGHAIPTTIEQWDEDWRPGLSFWDANAAPDHPIVGVSHDDARAFLAWLTATTGSPYRLPTEAEYGYAARAGCDCGSSCRAAAALPDHFVRAGGRAAIRAVAMGPPNAFGLYDMHGLIWQWCADWYDELAPSDASDPRGPDEPPAFVTWKGAVKPPGRVICGGSFSYSRDHASCHHRHFSLIGDRNFNVGLRAARSLPVEP